MSRKTLLILLCLLSLSFGWAHASVSIRPMAQTIEANCGLFANIDHCKNNGDLEQGRCALCFALVTPTILQSSEPYNRAKHQPIPEPFFDSRTIQPQSPIPILIAET